jgi:hypothetical protein
MEDRRVVYGYEFEKLEDEDVFECRGEVCYDDEHDQIPEQGLWIAAQELVNQLIQEGYEYAVREHSEKGWVEVNY